MSLLITDINAANIEAAIAAGGNIWESPLLADFKSKVKQYYRGILDEQCCYCRKNTLAEFKMVLDIEHILPKSKFIHWMFSLFNLSVSCKRCNMNIKKEDASFITDVGVLNQDPQNPTVYRIVHPNLDDYFSHINYFTKTVNERKIIKYTIVASSAKGQYTYDYFKLSDLETDSINRAQGVKEMEDLSELITPAAAKRIEDLLKKIKK